MGDIKNSDHDQIACDEDHELEYVLKKFGKKGTQANIKALRAVCQKFKSSSKVDDRAHFYKYLEANKSLKKLE